LYTARRFPILPILTWTRNVLVLSFLWSLLLTYIYAELGQTWIELPAMPFTVLGTAVSFYLGFKGNAAYDRLWEARKIWGAIVNTSRTWGTQVTTYVGRNSPEAWNDAELPGLRQELIYRHVAWLAALRTQLRMFRQWEHDEYRYHLWREAHGTSETSDDDLRRRMQPFLVPVEINEIMVFRNRATQLLHKQMVRIAELRDEGLLDSFEHLQMSQSVEHMFTQQGQCERIKNFPLPRQYSSLNHWFVLMFVTVAPLALLTQFSEPGLWIWMTIPSHMGLAWIFYVWDRVVDMHENPFEGLANDIPMTTLSRTIEIDLREMLGESDLPGPVPRPHPDLEM
jgi:putative membrane protein